LGLDRLHVDIVDYPGEWLIDLALLDQSYTSWCEEALRKARAPQRSKFSDAWRNFALRAWSIADAEQAAIEGAKLFTDYLAAAKTSEHGVGALTPGRFLMPGDLSGSPLLTFFPLDLAATPDAANSALARLLERRFESYKREVVKPFFRNHFLKLDRQVVLVDVLGALSRGPESVADLEDALTSVLSAFRPGSNTWLSSLYTRRIDRVLFAATKADHVSRTSHDRLEAILQRKPIRLHPDKPNNYNPIYEDDYVALGIRAMEVAATPPVVVNWAGSETVSVEDYCGYMGELVGIEPIFEYTPQAHTPLWPDVGHMHEVLGRTRVHWRDGMRRMIKSLHPELVLKEEP